VRAGSESVQVKARVVAAPPCRFMAVEHAGLEGGKRAELLCGAPGRRVPRDCGRAIGWGKETQIAQGAGGTK